MPDPPSSSTTSRAHRLVKDALLGLAKIRNENGNWIDSESESEAVSQAYKRLNALSCFLATKPYPAIWNFVAQETRSWLRQDLEKVMIFIQEEGFNPIPYAGVISPGLVFFDFACDVLSFCGDLADAFAEDAQLMDKAKECSIKAFEELTGEGHFYRDESGCAWAPTPRFEDRRKAPAYNTYFTSLFSLAIYRGLNQPLVKEWWGEERCSRGLTLAREACRYLLAAANNGQIMPTTDIDPTNVALFEKLIYTCWGLRALLTCWEWLDASQQNMVKPVAQGFLQLMESSWSEKAFDHKAILPNGDESTYEHRTSLGGLITTLAELKRRNISDLQLSLHNIAYKHYRLLLDYRDAATHLWYSEMDEVASMPYIINDLLLFGDAFGDLDKDLNIPIPELKTQVEDILKKSNIIENIAEIITRGLSTMADSSETEGILKKLATEEEPPRGAVPAKPPRKRKKKKK